MTVSTLRYYPTYHSQRWDSFPQGILRVFSMIVLALKLSLTFQARVDWNYVFINSIGQNIFIFSKVARSIQPSSFLGEERCGHRRSLLIIDLIIARWAKSSRHYLQSTFCCPFLSSRHCTCDHLTQPASLALLNRSTGSMSLYGHVAGIAVGGGFSQVQLSKKPHYFAHLQ